MRSVFAAALVLCLGGCATSPVQTLPQTAAWLTAGGTPPPPQAQCPYVSDVDLVSIAAERARERAGPDHERYRAYYDGLYNSVAIGPGFRSPPSDALVVLTSVEPPGGMYMNTVWTVVWQETDGSWWFWRQNRTNEPPPPPPPPPPAEASEAAHQAYRAEMADYPPPDHVRWPPTFGSLSASQASALEAALANPCRALEPDLWPWNPPLRRSRAQPGPPHPHDWTPTHVWIEEMGRPARRLTASNERSSHVGAIVSVARYPRAD
jgi:hypothetical protein